MGTLVDIVGNEEAGVDCIISHKAADPVVYQLARVDGDGRLVPATEDEVMAVEDLLEEDKSNVRTLDTGQILECSTNGSEGQPQLEILEIGTEKPNIPPHPMMDSEEVDVHPKERIPSLVCHGSDGSVCQSGSPGECSKTFSELDRSKTNSSFDTGMKPDFSLLNGEIHLDNLSVKDLQETFKATFGRETSVKDKQWLKRRIIMGLTNSCDFSTTSFVIIDNRVGRKQKTETCESVDCSVLFDCVVTSAMENHESPSTSHDKKSEIHSIANETNMESSTFQDKSGGKDAETEERPAKRIRKPTKRYIEELSEGESRDSGAKIVSSVKHPAYDQPSAKVWARPVQNFGLDRRYLTRKDSLGGSGIQIPYVSRIRRSRPRENLMNLMKLQPSGEGISISLEKNDVASSTQLDKECGNNAPKNSLSPRWIEEPPVVASERSTPYTERTTIQLEEEVKLKNVESYRNNSDEEVVTVPTANGGMRRKHHRPWTLSEVVKLVDGVAKYGAGRWSEIKRLAFASYSYRTSVDLKDKWRNLLRASLAELPTGNGMHGSRKQASVPIPAPILSRVRELAEMQTHVPPSISYCKLAERNEPNKTVHETRSGFL
ncbi:uncharacterized protein LOC105163216 isoform X1 [Sesamum indicum]|uniref:Uncharacterized protein LOC105163216 isoform X1 n=1 Tax=Sesamum indicum TaxID=4182 RepID=A0A6I9TGJ4_SESIN|nr:uncharacterized protein LOC105163216 isoform X1 [Sesamum indicum]